MAVFTMYFTYVSILYLFQKQETVKEEKLLSLPKSNSIVDAEEKEHSDRKYRSVSHVELSIQSPYL
jgi:hypothetical protein